MFTSIQVFPGVTHITDCMGVSFTLLEGSDSALLIDAGYGIEDVRAYVETLTDRPVELLQILPGHPAFPEPPGTQHMIMMTVGQNQLHRPVCQRFDIGPDILYAVAGVDQQGGVAAFQQGKADPHAVRDVRDSGENWY